MKETLLIMGVDSSTRFVLEYLKECGVRTIITDYMTPEQQPLKLVSDDYWMLNVGDLDEIEKKCREEGVTGIFAGNHEFCLDMTKELCKRMGFPFYAPDFGWQVARDKSLFKKIAGECGFGLPQRYDVQMGFTLEDVKGLPYPVIVKPSDASSQRGISVCRTPEELIPGYEFALQYSHDKNIIVEDYIEGEEFLFIYYVNDGVPYLMTVTDGLQILVNGRKNFSFAPNQGMYYDEYVAEMDGKVEKFIEKINYKNGVFFLQALRNEEGKYHFLELGCRLDGACTWVPVEAATGFNYMKKMVDIARGKNPVLDLSQYDFSMKGKHTAIYMYWAKPGHVADIHGEDLINETDGLIFAFQRFKPGDNVEKTDNMTQIAYFIEIIGKDKEDLIAKLKYINENLYLVNDEGENLMYRYDDYDFIRDHY